MISLESVDQVRERTGVGYKDAKDALETTNGDVLEAIIMLEEKQGQCNGPNMHEVGNEIIDTLKQMIKKGNVTRITVEKDEKVVLNIPVVAGAVGALLFTPATIAGILGSLVAGCELKVLKEDGEIINVKDVTEDTIQSVIVKVDELRDKINKEFETSTSEDESTQEENTEEEAQEEPVSLSKDEEQEL